MVWITSKEAKMPSKKKTYTYSQLDQAIKAAYRLGIQDGLEKNQRLLQCMATANHNLWDEICRMDEYQPMNGVSVSLKTAIGILKFLKKKQASPPLIAKLEANIEYWTLELSKLNEQVIITEVSMS
jgi:hypothetical protein